MATVEVPGQTPASGQPLEIPRNCDWSAVLGFEDEAGQPIDVSQHTFTATLRRDPTGDVEASFSFDHDTDAGGAALADHQVRMYVEPADTADLDPAPHVFDLRATEPDGATYLLWRDPVYITAEVTEAP